MPKGCKSICRAGTCVESKIHSQMDAIGKEHDWFRSLHLKDDDDADATTNPTQQDRPGQEERQDVHDSHSDSQQPSDLELAHLRWQSSMKLRHAWERIFARVANDGDPSRGDSSSVPDEASLLALMADWNPRLRLASPMHPDVQSRERAEHSGDVSEASEEENDEDIIDFSRPDWEDTLCGRPSKKPSWQDVCSDLHFVAATGGTSDTSEDEDAAWFASHTPQKRRAAPARFRSESDMFASANDGTRSAMYPTSSHPINMDVAKFKSTESVSSGLPPTMEVNEPKTPWSKRTKTPKSGARLPANDSKRRRQSAFSPVDTHSPVEETSSPVVSIERSRSTRSIERSGSARPHHVPCLGAGKCTKSMCLMCGTIGSPVSVHKKQTCA